MAAGEPACQPDARIWTGRGEAHELPDRKCGWNTRSRGGTWASAPSDIRSSRQAIAACAISAIGCAEVVTRGRTSPLQGTSSMPTSETSAGQLNPRSRIACKCTERHHVVGADDRGRPVGAGHQRLGRLVGGCRHDSCRQRTGWDRPERLRPPSSRRRRRAARSAVHMPAVPVIMAIRRWPSRSRYCVSMRVAARLSTPRKSRARPGTLLSTVTIGGRLCALEQLDIVGAASDRHQDDAGDVLGAKLGKHGELAPGVVVGHAHDDRVAGRDRRVLHRAHHR